MARWYKCNRKLLHLNLRKRWDFMRVSHRQKKMGYYFKMNYTPRIRHKFRWRKPYFKFPK